MIKRLYSFWKKSKYLADENGVSALEMGVLFPVLLSLLMAVYDLGQGLVVNQKTVAASQIIADLITRREVVDMAIISDVARAGEMALDPYSTTPFGYDIASIVFDENDEPIVLWRVTHNMVATEDAVNDTVGLGGKDEGVVVVSAQYTYNPLFSAFVIDEFNMTERAFLRGRKSETVSCTDC